MAYHSEFWIAIAAAVPVIGLAHVVFIERFMRSRNGVPFCISLVGLVTAGVELCIALNALSTGNDHNAIAWAMWLTGVPYFALPTAAIVAGLLGRYEDGRHEDARHEAGADDDRNGAR